MKQIAFTCLALGLQGAAVALEIDESSVVAETINNIQHVHNEYSFANQDHTVFIKVDDFVPEHIIDYFNKNQINIYTTDSSRYFAARFCDTCPLVAGMNAWLTYPVATPNGVRVMQLPQPSINQWWNDDPGPFQDKHWIGDVVWHEPHCIHNCASTSAPATHQANSTRPEAQSTTVYKNATSKATAVVPTTTIHDTTTTALTNTTRSVTTPSEPPGKALKIVLSAVLGCPTCVAGLRPTSFTKYIPIVPDTTVTASTTTRTGFAYASGRGSSTTAVGPGPASPSFPANHTVQRYQGDAAEVTSRSSKWAMLSFVLAAVVLL